MRFGLFAFAFFAIAPYQGAVGETDALVGIRIEPEATVPYDRDKDYGGWIRMNAPYNRCFNVRDQVLSDESAKTAFKFGPPSDGNWRCKVTAGSWLDPYSGKSFTDPQQLEIEHVVPLKEAHASGAYLWPKAKRTEYANDLRDPHHLIAISASENSKKGDREPQSYMPPNAAYACTYLEYWVAIKRRWDLSMDQVEAAFIRMALADC